MRLEIFSSNRSDFAVGHRSTEVDGDGFDGFDIGHLFLTGIIIYILDDE